MKEAITAVVKIEVTQESDRWHGRVYKKVGKEWFSAAVITPRTTEHEARSATIALASYVMRLQ